jgi:hypothetical protein
VVVELLQERTALLLVEGGDVIPLVHLQPLLRGAGLAKAVEVTPRVQPESAPVGAGEERYRDLLEPRGALAVMGPVERVLQGLRQHVHAVSLQLLVGENPGTAHRAPVVHVAEVAPGVPVLDRDHLALRPLGREDVAQDPAVAQHVPVGVVSALPGGDRRQVGRTERSHVPLDHRVVGDSREAHPAVAPGLRSRPLDRVVEVEDLPRLEGLELAGRLPGAARVDADHDVAIGDPDLRIGGLPAVILAARALTEAGDVRDHLLPDLGMEVAGVDVLPVDRHRHQDGIPPLRLGSEQVGHQEGSIAGRNRHVLLEEDALPDLGGLGRAGDRKRGGDRRQQEAEGQGDRFHRMPPFVHQSRPSIHPASGSGV